LAPGPASGYNSTAYLVLAELTDPAIPNCISRDRAMTDRNFFKTFTGLMGALVALTVIIYVLAQMVAGKTNLRAPEAKQGENAIAERIKPVGEVTMGAMNALVPAANAAGDKGEATFNASCVACHGAGIAGAPKVGDKAAWAPRIAQGMPKLEEHALKGFTGKSGMMPAKGGNPALADADVKAAVAYMANKSK
jgi:cytochrome c5